MNDTAKNWAQKNRAILAEAGRRQEALERRCNLRTTYALHLLAGGFWLDSPARVLEESARATELLRLADALAAADAARRDADTAAELEKIKAETAAKSAPA
jgi:hypothetical protein